MSAIMFPGAFPATKGDNIRKERKGSLRNLTWRLAIVIIVSVGALILVLPTIHMEMTHSNEPVLWPKKQINLGLDLQGGMHLVLEVDADKAVETTMERKAQEMQNLVIDEKLRGILIEHTGKNEVEVQIGENGKLDEFNSLLDKDFPELKILSKTNNGRHMVLGLSDDEIAQIKKFAVAQARETIRNRIDQFGVSEPDIRLQGEDRILIQLPGVKESDRAKGVIGQTAMLEFKLVDDAGNPQKVEETGDVPPGSELLYLVRKNRETGREIKSPILLKKRALLTGEYLVDAKVQIDSQFNEPYVAIEFDKKGARIFEKVTEENVNRQLAIVLDNVVHSSPVIQEKISGGQARITGSFTMDEAQSLAIVLRSGALPAPVNIIEERTVGASLGKDSINKGILSMIVGGILVILFMVIYYKGSGIVADIALVLNILLIAGGLAIFQATLTLPGIAGVILTIGMAVDANVLIFERIREELLLGKTPGSAVDAGYDRATLTILDANVTTLIAALVLFQFGTGPVKGFAVTLCLGVLSSLFTALFVTRLIFDYLLYKRRIKTLSI